MNYGKKVNGQMVRIARESRGLLQAELSEITGISKTALNRIEQNVYETSETSVDLITNALKYPRSFFYQTGEQVPLALSYRKRDKVSAKVLSKIDANVNVYRLNIESVIEVLGLNEVQLPQLDVLALGSPANCAKELRKIWNIPSGPITNLSEILEHNGITLLSFDFETDRVDGRFMMALDKFPVIVTNKRLLGDRQRFTLAYQLGHIVMHLYTSPGFKRDLPHEANLFAAEFLMPTEDINDDLTDLTLPKLGELKRKWKVSMQALLYRASDLTVISEKQKKSLLKIFNQQNIRRREPRELDVPVEAYHAIKDKFTQYRTKQKMSLAKFAALLHLEIPDFIERYGN